MEQPFYTRFVLRDRERDRRSSPATVKDRAGTDERGLVCVVCGHLISDDDHRIEMAGAHEHTFVNPGGFVHHIGCYSAAPGCIYLGPTESAFSWFPGWTWQVAACALSCTRRLDLSQQRRAVSRPHHDRDPPRVMRAITSTRAS